MTSTSRRQDQLRKGVAGCIEGFSSLIRCTLASEIGSGVIYIAAFCIKIAMLFNKKSKMTSNDKRLRTNRIRSQ